MEMLVVLVLTAAITGILLQALHQVYRLQTHFTAQIFNTQQGAMLTDWFRQSVNGIMPDYEDGAHKFHGDQREFGGLTTSSLDGHIGAVAPFVWRLVFDPRTGESQLRYGSGDNAPTILSWPGNSGRFVYLDADGAEHDTWPPFLGKWPQLPGVILLDTKLADRMAIIVAAPKGPEKLPPRQRDLQD